MVTDDQVLQPHQQFAVKLAPRPIRKLADLRLQLLKHQHNMTQQLTLVGVRQRPLDRDLTHLAQVVKEHTRQQQVAVQERIQTQNAFGRLHQRGDVFQQPTAESVVDLDPRHRSRQRIHQGLVFKKTDHQFPKISVVQAPEQFVDANQMTL